MNTIKTTILNFVIEFIFRRLSKVAFTIPNDDYEYVYENPGEVTYALAHPIFTTWLVIYKIIGSLKAINIYGIAISTKTANEVDIVLSTNIPSYFIGKNGSTVMEIENVLKTLFKRNVVLNIREVPELAQYKRRYVF